MFLFFNFSEIPPASIHLSPLLLLSLIKRGNPKTSGLLQRGKGPQTTGLLTEPQTPEVSQGGKETSGLFPEL